jgi:hypothetical protein
MVEIVQASFERDEAFQLPTVAVGIVVNRPIDDPLTKQAFQSLTVQSYPTFKVYTLDNLKAGISIGAARNAIVRNTDADLITFLDQWDELMPDALQSMVDMFHLNRKELQKLVHLSTACLVARKNGDMVLSSHRSPGIFKREWLVKHPFPEQGLTFPDRYQVDKLAAFTGRKQASIHIGHHFGYVYRDYPFRQDGVKP